MANAIPIQVALMVYLSTHIPLADQLIFRALGTFVNAKLTNPFDHPPDVLIKCSYTTPHFQGFQLSNTCLATLVTNHDYLNLKLGFERDNLHQHHSTSTAPLKIHLWSS